MTDRILLAEASIVTPAVIACLMSCLPRGWVVWVGRAGAVLTAGLAVTTAGLALADPAHPRVGSWIALDAFGGCSSP